MRKGTKLYHFACTTGKNTTQNTPKFIILRAKIKNGEGHPLFTPHLFRHPNPCAWTAALRPPPPRNWATQQFWPGAPYVDIVHAHCCTIAFYMLLLVHLMYVSCCHVMKWNNLHWPSYPWMTSSDHVIWVLTSFLAWWLERSLSIWCYWLSLLAMLLVL